MTDYDTYKRRLGAIKYTGEFLEDGGCELLYANFIPLFLTFDPSENIYIAKGLSKQFRELALGEQIPSYRATIQKVPTDYDYTYHLTFTEVIDVCG